MKGLLNILKSRYFLITVGMLILVALVFLLGAVLAWPPVYQLIGVIVVLVLFIVLLAIGFVKANQSANQIEQSIKMQAQQQLMSARPDKRAEIEALQTDLERSIEQLKQSKLGRGRRGTAALYALPWYMFIGPPAAGKTTTIANSGLNFPLGTDRVRGVGGTRNCDWFFSDSAILLDTAGRYTTEYEDNDEWLAFLDTLRKHRKDQPVNGVLVGISIADLVASDSSEVDWHADTIRRRVDELVKHLGVRFPVYLVFTKCDLLQGFAEFFGDLTRQEREQVWGATLDPEPEGSEKLPARDRFEQEFDLLYDGLINARLERLSRSMKREERNKVYTFPLQFAAAKDSLSRFVHQLFLPNPYQETPIFRGFYFTSGTQEGVPIDRVIQALAQQFDLAPDAGGGFEPAVDTKAYFIKDVFTEVVIPDQYLVERTSRATRQSHLLRAGVVAASLVGLGLFVLWAVLALRGGLSELDATRQATTPFQTITWNNVEPRQAQANVRALDSLRAQIEMLEEGSFFSLGLRPRASVLDSARALYQANLRAFVEAYPVDALGRQLREAQPGLEQADKDTLFQDLKTYLLVTDADPSLDGRRDSLTQVEAATLANRLSFRAATALVPDGASRIVAVQDQVRPHMEAFVAALRAGEQARFEALRRGDLVRASRDAVGDINESMYYEKVLSTARSQLPPQGQRRLLRDIVATGAAFFLNDSLGVDGVYTLRGEDLVLAAIERESDDPYSETWVLGRRPGETARLEDLEQKLQARYYSDYATAWSSFLRAVRLNGYGSVAAARDAIATLSNPQRSPVVRLLATATVETDLCNRISGLLGDSAPEQATDAIPCAGAGVNDQFRWLHEYQFNRAESGSGSPDVDILLQSYGDVRADLDIVAGNRDEALAYAEQLLGNNEFGLGGKLREVERTLSGFDQNVRQNLFVAPIERAGGAVIGTAEAELSDRWRRTVYEAFDRELAQRYPFSSDPSAPDADFGTVSDFFEPDPGVSPVAAFLEDMRPFMRDGDLSRPLDWRGNRLSLSENTRSALQQAEAIGRVLAGGGRLAFRMRPEQAERDPSDAQVYPGQLRLEIHGQSYDSYEQGGFRPRWDFTWPGDERGVAMQIDGRAGSGNQNETLAQLSKDGTWALFRFMEEARGESEPSPGLFERYWVLPSPSGRYSIVQKFEIEVDRRWEDMLLEPRRFFRFSPPASLSR